MAFNPNRLPEATWNERYKPIGFGTLLCESFSEWDDRVGHYLSNLCAEIREQWIYRHWTYSPMTFVPLETLGWREEKWAPHKFLAEVGLLNGDGDFDPEYTYQVLSESFGRKHPTAEALDKGEWDFAPLVLSTPNGFVDDKHNLCDVSTYRIDLGFEQRRISGSSKPLWSEDEQEIRNIEGCR